jgi:hypothetical protein
MSRDETRLQYYLIPEVRLHTWKKAKKNTCGCWPERQYVTRFCQENDSIRDIENQTGMADIWDEYRTWPKELDWAYAREGHRGTRNMWDRKMPGNWSWDRDVKPKCESCCQPGLDYV